MLRLRHRHRHLRLCDLLRFLLSHHLSTANSGITASTSPTVTVSDISTLRSKSDLLASYTVTPPIQPWPDPLFPRRLALIIRRQTDLSLALRIFYHAADYVPGFRHTYFTYHTIIDKLAHARAFPELESILSHLAKSSVRCGEEAFITVIRAYGFAGKPAAALKIFLAIRPKFGVNVSVRAFNSLLNAMIQNRRFDLVAVLFKNCQSKFGIRPNIFSCNIFLKALCKLDDLDGALKMLEEIPNWGMIPNLITYTTVLSGYCARGDMDGARNFFEEILERGWSPDATAYTVLIDGYCRVGRYVDAAKIMDEMEENKVLPNDVTYSVMIESLCKDTGNKKRSGKALNLLLDMLDANYMPLSSMCCKVIDVLCEDGKVDDACRLWRKMLHKNYMPDNFILTTLIYWLCKVGKAVAAMSLFREFKKALVPSVSTYNALISGMCENGELQEAGRLWDDMMENRCYPNIFTYNVLIKGFCKAGKLEEGVRVLEEMLKKGCPPNKTTYGVLINELCRSGQDERVVEVLRLGVSSCCGFDVDCWDVFVRMFVVKKFEESNLSMFLHI